MSLSGSYEYDPVYEYVLNMSLSYVTFFLFWQWIGYPITDAFLASFLESEN